MTSRRCDGPSLEVGLMFCDVQFPTLSWQVLGWDDEEVNFWRPADQYRQTLTMSEWNNAWAQGWLELRA